MLFKINKLSFYAPVIVIRVLIVLLLCSFFVIQANSSSVEEIEETSAASTTDIQPEMPFKLGFEFQEVNALCEWALNNSLVQKKPIFSVKNLETGETLWDLVIDTNDIEFVTRPFAYNQKFLLKKSIQSISLSFKALVDLLNSQEDVTFEQWTHDIQGRLGENGCALDFAELMHTVAQRALKKPSPVWIPGFNPQATIQHPLEFTIPLYFGLFGFDNPNYTIPFSSSLPGIEFLKGAMKEGDGSMFSKIIQGYTKKKLSGLIFLHALTLVAMTPDQDADDTNLLSETAEFLKKYQQVDIKAKLALMSRRPFSLMWHEIKKPHESYGMMFNSMMSKNSFFVRRKLSKLFDRTNYAEQIFQPETGAMVPFQGALMPLLEESFVAQNRDILTCLLEHGVINTTMIRNFKAGATLGGLLGVDSLKDYYKRGVESVETPETTRYIISLDEVGEMGWAYDVLSPPLLLDSTNAMGYFKMPLSPEERLCGEAIVEVRAIRDVAERFLKKMGLDVAKQGRFLKDPDQIEEDSLSLFDYLFNFGDTDVVDFSVGLPYTLLNSHLTY